MSRIVVTETMYTLTAGEPLSVSRPYQWSPNQTIIIDARGKGGAMTFTLDSDQLVISPEDVFSLIQAPHGVVRIKLVTDLDPDN
jgi:hypothetical protein